MAYEQYLPSGYCHRPTDKDPRRGFGELVLHNLAAEPCQAVMTVYFAARPPAVLAPVAVGPETNELVIMPDLAPEVFSDCGFWGIRVVSNTPLMLNLINSVRIMPDPPKYRGGTTNWHGVRPNREWFFPDGLWLERSQIEEGEYGAAHFPHNEFEYYFYLNPNHEPARVTMMLQYRNLDPMPVHLTVPAERVLVWENRGKVARNEPYAVHVTSSLPVAANACRYVYGLKGIEEWGQQVHHCIFGVPGPIVC